MKDFDRQLLQDLHFQQGLEITQRWCAQHRGGAALLWPESLRPEVDNYSLSAVEIDRLNWIKAAQLVTPDGTLSDGQQGRVLMVYPFHSLNDASMEAESDGMIDEYDLPPWATWFYYTEDSDEEYYNALYVWIPQDFVAAIEQAMEVDTYDSLLWLT